MIPIELLEGPCDVGGTADRRRRPEPVGHGPAQQALVEAERLRGTGGSAVGADDRPEVHLLNAVQRNEVVAKTHAAGHVGRVDPDVLESAEVEQVRDRCADSRHRQRFADLSLNQGGGGRILDRAAFGQHADFDDGFPDICRGIRRRRLAEPCARTRARARARGTESGASPSMLHAEVDREGAVAGRGQDPPDPLVFVVFQDEHLVSSG